MVPRSMSNRSCDLRLSLLSARRPEPSSVDRLPLFCGLYAVCFCIYVPNFHPNFCFIPAALIGQFTLLFIQQTAFLI